MLNHNWENKNLANRIESPHLTGARTLYLVKILVFPHYQKGHFTLILQVPYVYILSGIVLDAARVLPAHIYWALSISDVSGFPSEQGRPHLFM
jgi:hypothetical protein